MADRVTADPLMASDHWRPTGVHDSVISHNPTEPSVTLVTEKNLRIDIFHGTQDSRNQVPYLRWARQMTNYVRTKGSQGVELANAMEWSTKQSREILTRDKIRVKFPMIDLQGSLHSLMLFIENNTKGEAAEVVATADHRNGLDAWRKLCHDQLPFEQYQVQRLKEQQRAASHVKTWSAGTAEAAAPVKTWSAGTVGSAAHLEFGVQELLDPLPISKLGWLYWPVPATSSWGSMWGGNG